MSEISLTSQIINNLQNGSTGVTGNSNGNIANNKLPQENSANINSGNLKQNSAIESESKATSNSGAQSSNNLENSAEREKKISQQIQKILNPSPMLSQAILFKWDASAGGAVINVVDFKTGKVLAQIPPSQVLKNMANYQKGSLYENKF